MRDLTAGGRQISHAGKHSVRSLREGKGEGMEKEKFREEEEEESRTNQPFQKSGGKVGGSGQSLALKGTFVPAHRLCSDTAAIGAWVSQRTAWLHPAR